MGHKHFTLIQKVFAHPISSNIDLKKLKHTLEHFGAEISTANNRVHIVIKGKTLILGLPHHGHELSDKSEVIKLRHYLEEVGLTPELVK